MSRSNMWAIAALSCALVAVITPAARAQSVVYDNANPLAPSYYPLFDDEELADDVTLGGTDRVVTSFSVEAISNFALPFTGNAVARFYNFDLNTGLPQDLPFWTGTTPLPGLVGENTVTWAVPFQTVADSFVWSVTFESTLPPAGLDEDFGVLLNDLPSVGSSDDIFFQRLANGDWEAFNFTVDGGTDLANFQATITAVPEPGMAGLALIAGVAALARRRP